MLPPGLPAWLEEIGPRVLVFDLETESDVDLTRHMAGRYFSDPSTRVTLACWKWLGHEDVLADPDPQMHRLRAALAEADVVVAHNATFDLLGVRTGLPPEQRRIGEVLPGVRAKLACTMAMCASLNYPRSLEKAARLINERRFKKEMPAELRAATKGQPMDMFADADPDRQKKFIDYCKGDVLATEELFERLVERTSPEEFDAVDAHLRINCRGIPFDRKGLAEAIAERRPAYDQLETDFGLRTGFSLRQVEELKDYLNARAQEPALPGEDPPEPILKGAAEDDLEKALPRLSEELAELARMRLNSVRVNPVKLEAIEESATAGTSPTTWLRDAFRFAEATTGRWSSRGINMQNCKRGGIEKRLARAPQGFRLYVGDYSQVELRMALWVCGDLAALRKLHYEGDFYKEVASRIFSKPVSGITKAERFIGKSLVLGCNYQMGPPKFQAFVQRSGGEISAEDAEKYVADYRRSLPCLPRAWAGLMRAAIGALRRPQQGWVHPEGVQHCSFFYDVPSKELLLRLPTRRILRYADCSLVEDGNGRPQIVYHDFSRGQSTGAKRHLAHGGLLLENVCQAASRDLLCRSLVAFERELGIDEGVVAHVHDEVVALVRADRTKEQLDDLLVPPAFREGEGKGGLLLACESDIAVRWGDAK